MIPNLKYKTTYCNNWLEGTSCDKGNGCFFAHGQHELRSLEQNKHIIAYKNTIQKNSPQQIDNYKTIYCKFFAKGQCKLGKDCTFAHQKKQKRRKPKIKQQKFQQQGPYYQGPLHPPIGGNFPVLYNMYYPTYFNYFGMGYPNYQYVQQNQINENVYLHQNQIQNQSNTNASQQLIIDKINNLYLNEPAEIMQQQQCLTGIKVEKGGLKVKKEGEIRQQSATKGLKKEQNQDILPKNNKEKDQVKEKEHLNKENQIQKSNQKRKNQQEQ